MKIDGACSNDYECKTKHCHWGTCKGLHYGQNINPNGWCYDSLDCTFKQYCSGKKCVNRVKNGFCRKDHHCLSNHCSGWFIRKCDNSMLEDQLNKRKNSTGIYE
jgi:hypothetical protein